MALVRELPQHLEAEKALLGAVLLEPQSFYRVVDTGIRKDDFFSPAHGLIFESLIELVSRSQPVDLITLSHHMELKGDLVKIGGAAYLSALFAEAYSAGHIEAHGKIIQQKSLLRRLIQFSSQLSDSCYTEPKDFDNLLDRLEADFFNLTHSSSQSSVATLGDVAGDVYSHIQKLSLNRSAVTGLATGYHGFDLMTAGLHPGQLVILAARPAMGKTSLALNLALNAATQHKSAVVIFSLEMARQELGMRFLSAQAKIPSFKLKTGQNISTNEWKILGEAAQILQNSKVFIDDSPLLTVLEMRSKCRRLSVDQHLGLIIVDYLQLMKGTSSGNGENREREISEISRGLKALAKELKVPVLALSQLNRSVEARADKRPMLSDLRESGAIEQDADIVTFVYRDEVYNKESPDKGKAEWIIAKHRAGDTGTIVLNWNAELTLFSDLPDVASVTPQQYNPGLSERESMQQQQGLPSPAQRGGGSGGAGQGASNLSGGSSRSRDFGFVEKSSLSRDWSPPASSPSGQEGHLTPSNRPALGSLHEELPED